MNGRAIINLVVGVLATVNVVYKVIKGPFEADRFFGFEIPGIAYLAIWTFFAVSCFYAFNKARNMPSR